MDICIGVVTLDLMSRAYIMLTERGETCLGGESNFVKEASWRPRLKSIFSRKMFHGLLEPTKLIPL